MAPAVGMLLARPTALRVAASSSEEGRLLELVDLQSDEGPCLECIYRLSGPLRCELVFEVVSTTGRRVRRVHRREN